MKASKLKPPSWSLKNYNKPVNPSPPPPTLLDVHLHEFTRFVM